MLWISPSETDFPVQESSVPSFYHAYSIANNFFGRDHVILFWACIGREYENPVPYERFAPDICSFPEEEQARIRDYVDRLFTKKEVMALEGYLARQFDQNLVSVEERVPLHPRFMESVPAWEDVVSTGVFVWNMPDSFSLKSGFQVRAIYDLRVAMPMARSTIDMRPTLDTLDIGALKKK